MLSQYPGVCKCLNAHEVRDAVVGGLAAILHGIPRVKFDIDPFVARDIENVRRLVDALREHGLGTVELTNAEAIEAHEITIFRDRVRVDVLTLIPGVTFDDAYAAREIRVIEGVPTPILSRAHLIASKRAAGGPKDLDDVRGLEGLLP